MQTNSTQTPNIGRRYLLHESIGEGGMGMVYRATDRLTGRVLALKRVLRDVNKLNGSNNTYDATDFRLAMAREFKLSASLRHPNIIKVLDYGFDDDRHPYYTMEYLPNARTIVDAGQDFSLVDKVDLLIQTLNALAYLHRRGILHRDLKPANILMLDNQVKVLDFGLSVMHEQTRQRGSESDTTAGTLAYIAPELLMADDSGIPGDLYAIGMIAYELFAGQHPFNLDSPGELVQQIIYKTPDVDTLDLPLALTEVLETLIEKDPKERYQSAEATLDALRGAIGHESNDDSHDIRDSYLRAARLVGRDTELKQLSDALNDATYQHGSAWLLAGENGVGKTRLMGELRRLAMV
ncbi:MAG: serine/threonine-protein kinase, partial [Aggregatilineales bacterium]